MFYFQPKQTKKLCIISNLNESFESILEIIEPIKDSYFIIMIAGIRNDSLNKDLFNVKYILNECNGIYILDDINLNFINNEKFSENLIFHEAMNWLSGQYLGARIRFTNQSQYLFMNGGISESYINKSVESLEMEVESAYIGRDGSVWQNKYNGKFGYVVSNFPLGDEIGLYAVSYTHLTLPTNREV